MKFTVFSLIFTFILCLAFFSCAPPQEEVDELDLTQVRKTIEAGNLKFTEGIRQGDSAALAASYTEDAIIMPPDADMIQGQRGIEEFWNGVIQMGAKDAVLTTVDLNGSGDFVYEIGKYNFTIQLEDQESMEAIGKYVVVWKKTADGTWKLHVDIWNSSMPPPAPPE